MNENEKSLKLEQLLNDTEFVTMLGSSADAEEMKKIFADKGLELTTEEVNAFTDMMDNAGEAELDETSLEEVSGGAGAPKWLWKLAKRCLVESVKKAWETGRMAAGK